MAVATDVKEKGLYAFEIGKFIALVVYAQSKCTAALESVELLNVAPVVSACFVLDLLVMLPHVSCLDPAGFAQSDAVQLLRAMQRLRQKEKD